MVAGRLSKPHARRRRRRAHLRWVEPEHGRCVRVVVDVDRYVSARLAWRDPAGW